MKRDELLKICEDIYENTESKNLLDNIHKIQILIVTNFPDFKVDVEILQSDCNRGEFDGDEHINYLLELIEDII
jgi:hypothetical protein